MLSSTQVGRAGRSIPPGSLLKAFRGSRASDPPLHADRRELFGQRRDRIIRRKHLPEPGEPARFFQMQVGDEQGLALGPEQRALRQRHQCLATERKGNHGLAMTG